MRKDFKILFLLVLMSVTASAQTLLVNHTDSATGSRLIQTSNQQGAELNMEDSVAKIGALFFAAGYQSATTGGRLVETYFIDLNIIHNDNRLGCLEQIESRIILTLEDDTKIECFQISDSDCDAVTYHAVFALMPKGGTVEVMRQNFKKLMTTRISKLLVLTTEGELDYKIKKESKPFLQKHFALIDKTVRGSLK